MEMSKIITLILSLGTFVFFPFENGFAKSDTHHVVSHPTEEHTDVHAKTETKTETHTKDTDTRVKHDDKTTDKKVSDKTDTQPYKADKPLQTDSDKEIANKLPDYLKDWMNYLNKTCDSHCTITSEEVLKLIEDPNITGQQAAVLGALVTQINNTNATNVKYTLKDLQDMFSADKSIYSYYYKTALENINGVRALSGPKEKLFGPTGALSSSTHIIQNSLGDCFILSAINGLLNIPGGPEKLQKMITRIPGKADEFLVSLPGDPKTILVKLTEAKLAMYSNVVQGGEWLAILSDAESRARKLNPESGIFQGGYQTQTLHLLTGNTYENKALSPFTPKQVDLLKNLDKDQWGALENLSNKQLAELSSLTEKQLEDTLTKDQLKAFKALTPEQLAELQKLSSAQWNELGTLIYSNQGKIDLKLLKTLEPLSPENLNKQIESQLNSALNESKPPKVVGIETNVHDLTILAYDPKTKTITIKNPWGTTGWYNPVTGDGPNTSRPKDGTTPPWFDMTKGVFQVKLSQLVESNFVTITLPKSIAKTDTSLHSSDKTQTKSDIIQMQNTLDQATKLSKADQEKIKANLDQAKAAIEQMKNYEEQIDAANGTCKQPGMSAVCKSHLKALSNQLDKAKSEAKTATDRVAEVVNQH